MAESEKLLKNAEDRLEAAEILLENEKYEDSVNRAYYSIYNSTLALLSVKGVSQKTHRGPIRQFGKKFVKTDEVPKKYSAILSKNASLRESSDYGIDPEISREDAKKSVEESREFLEMAKKHLDS